jgi:hypothetical protein
MNLDYNVVKLKFKLSKFPECNLPRRKITFGYSMTTVSCVQVDLETRLTADEGQQHVPKDAEPSSAP